MGLERRERVEAKTKGATCRLLPAHPLYHTDHVYAHVLWSNFRRRYAKMAAVRMPRKLTLAIFLMAAVSVAMRPAHGGIDWNGPEVDPDGLKVGAEVLSRGASWGIPTLDYKGRTVVSSTTAPPSEPSPRMSTSVPLNRRKPFCFALNASISLACSCTRFGVRPLAMVNDCEWSVTVNDPKHNLHPMCRRVVS